MISNILCCGRWHRKNNNTQDPQYGYLNWQFFVESVINDRAVFNTLIEVCQRYENELLVL